jgi:hypothetical protein
MSHALSRSGAATVKIFGFLFSTDFDRTPMYRTKIGKNQFKDD